MTEIMLTSCHRSYGDLCMWGRFVIYSLNLLMTLVSISSPLLCLIAIIFNRRDNGLSEMEMTL